jgi:cysteinyl-tRNA synthetase
VNPELSRNLLERRQQLLVWTAVIDIIEREHLKTSVLPVNWRNQLDFSQLRFIVADARSRRSELTHQEAREHAVCLEEAQAKVEVLVATASAQANITQAHDLLFALTKARLNLTKRLEDWRQLAGLGPDMHKPRPRPEREPQTVRPRATKRRNIARRGRGPRFGT